MGISVVSPVTEIVRLRCARSPRVLLLTDAASEDMIPQSIRAVADGTQYGNLLWDKTSEIDAAPFDSALLWCKGELPKVGTTAEWRRSFFSRPDCDLEVAVHWPCLEHADLVGLEPRILRRQPTARSWNPSLRVSGSVPSEKRKANWRASQQPWARLSAAICQELDRPNTGIDSFLELWNEHSSDARFSSLILRNLIVVLMKQRRWEKTGELLDLGEKAFPGYAEMAYLHAVFFLEQQSPARAIRFLETALSCRPSEFIGSGGENSFRAKYLLGLICDGVGQQEKAFNYWVPSVLEQPAFEPAVRALTQQRIPRARASQLYYPLAEMVRREPQYLEAVVDFLLEHRITLPARRLAETIAIVPARRTTLLERIGQAESRSQPQPRLSAAKPGIVLSGPIFDASGHARINREVGLAAIRAAYFKTSLDSTTWPSLSLQTLPHGALLREAAGKEIDSVDLTIRHQWPPNFARPASGKLVCILPWEHKAVPIRWIEEIEAKVDEVWTPSDFTRDSFIVAGISADRIRMLPNAIDRNVFRPDGPATRPPHSRGFVFLFVGGLIRRKGIDLLLQAYGDAFLPDEDVTLVLKDLGSRSFYSHNTQLQKALQFAMRPSSPHTLIVTEEFDDVALAALYRGADAFVLPYRAEGFGMPLIEAMACGKPVITTAEGPANEFCPDDKSFLVRATEVAVPEPAPPLGPLSSEWTWFEPDIAALASTMRYVYEHRDEAVGRGQAAAIAIQNSLTWDRISPMYLERIGRLVETGAPESQQI